MTNTPHLTYELLTKWSQRVRETQFCQYEASKPLAYANYWFGVPVVVLSTVVGTSVFATLEKQVDMSVRITIGIISVAAAVLASLHTFLRLAERAEKHRAVAVRAGSIRREIEQLLAIHASESVVAQDRLDRLRERIDKLAEDAPSVSDKIWNRAKRVELECEPTDPETSA